MKKYILRFLGITLLALSFLIIIFITREHTVYEDEMQNLLDNRVVITPSKNNTSTETQPDEDINDNGSSIIEGLEEDQTVQVTEGTPVISIPSLSILAPIVEGTSQSSLKRGAGRFKNSANIGEKGNFSLAGHSSTIYNQIFNGLESIRLLDKIECYDKFGTVYNYYVTDKFKVEATDTWVLNSTEDTRLTLVTCTDGGTRRFIVVAKLMSDSEFTDYKLYLRREQVSKAITVVDSSLDIDILSYFNSTVHISKVYRDIIYPLGLLKDYNTFKVGGTLEKNPHILDTDFIHNIGFIFSVGGD